MPTTTKIDELIQRLPPLPDHLTIYFARRWVAAAGEDPTPIDKLWCWDELVAHYSHLLALWYTYLEHATTGDPAWAALETARCKARSLRWRAFRVIESVCVGNPARAAYFAARYLGMNLERAARIIERALISEPKKASLIDRIRALEFHLNSVLELTGSCVSP